MDVESKPKKSKEPKQKRVFLGSQEFHHDLFKLEVAMTKKNIGTPRDPVGMDVEHVHFFHTVDQKGKKMLRSTPACGHFHELTLEEQEDGPPVIKSCSGPMEEKMVKRGGVIRRENRPKKEISPRYPDNHQHKAVYLKSDVIKLRKPNEEFIKLQNQMSQQRQPVRGIQG